MAKLVLLLFFVAVFTNQCYGLINGIPVESLSQANFVVAILEVDKMEKLVAVGAILRPRYVVTTASFYLKNKKYKVRAGSLNLTSGGATRDVIKVVVHNRYNRTTYENNVALFVLRTKLSFGNEIGRLIVSPGSSSVVAGAKEYRAYSWGKAETNSSSDVFVSRGVAIFPRKTCIPREIEVTENFLCVEIHDAIYEQNDIGMPMVNGSTLLGSAAFIGQEIQLYFDAFEVRSWIQSQIKKRPPKEKTSNHSLIIVPEQTLLSLVVFVVILGHRVFNNMNF